LFGKEKLVKDITLNDLDEDDRTFLQAGTIQILPFTDSAKRPIICQIAGLRAFKTITNELRARFYIYMTALKSQSTQLRGAVVVAYSIGNFQDKLNRPGFAENVKLAIALPFHKAGNHLCCDDVQQYIIQCAFISLSSAKFKARFKVHLGSHMECQYLLSTYGIPGEALPLSTTTNNLRLDYHLLWYNQCLQRETSSGLPQDAKTIPHQPHPNDVIFTGGKSSNNGGNQRLRLLTKRFLDSYNTSNNAKKRQLEDRIIEEISSFDGRFLKQDGSLGLWKELPLDEVRTKITQMFRNNRRAHAATEIVKSSHEGESNTLDHPGPDDVVFGKTRNNRGNKLVRQLVTDFAAEYDAANRGSKAKIADSIIQRTKSKGGRFLKQTESGRWEEVPNDFARAKISKHFRNNRRPPKPLGS
jgi:hypothetical protein